jgi:hypothetical protein
MFKKGLTDNLQTHSTFPVHIFLVILVLFKQMSAKIVGLGNLCHLIGG